MDTYDHKQILSDYANSKMPVEMAMGHSLQHIDKLYEAQTAANVSRYELRGKIDTLENRVNALQTKVDRLTALIEKLLPKRKRNVCGKQQKDQG
jgi:chaperonin cofactor prefoldin